MKSKGVTELLNYTNLIKIGIILSCTFLLFGCMYGLKKAKNPENYVLGFPPKDSPALVSMMNNYLILNKQHLLSKEDIYIITNHNINLEYKEITYHQYTTKDLTHYYSNLRNTEDISKEFYQLMEGQNFTQEVEELEKWNLPKIVLQDNNQLYIQTYMKEKTIDLNKIGSANNIDFSDQLLITLQSINKNSLLLQIEDTKKSREKRTYKWFLKQDLSDSVLIKNTEDDLEKFLEEESFKDYQELFQKIDDQEKYIQSYFVDKIIDTNKKSILEVSQEDYLSIDGEYVYIDGKMDPLTDGTQKIQRIEDYIEGNDTYYAEFEIDFDYIDQLLDLGSIDISIADIVYFNKDYIVLFLEFAGPITGSVGSTNVIIDLQEDKNHPLFYIVDLDLK